MANPYLVIGGIAVGIATAGFGILQVPGWIKSAQDASAINDLSNVAIGENIGSTMGIGYLNGSELTDKADELGMSFSPSSGVQLCVTRSDDATAFAALALSPSGAFFARTADVNKTIEADTAEAAFDAIGGLPAGVPAPVIGDDNDCAPGAEVIPNRGGAGGGPGGGGGGGGGIGDGSSAGELGPLELGFAHRTVWAGSGVFLPTKHSAVYGPGDGESYSVPFTGEILDERGFRATDIQSDRAGNAYIQGWSNDSDSLFKVSDGWRTTKVAETSGTNQFAVTPDGSTIFFTDWSDNLNRMTGLDTYEQVGSIGFSPRALVATDNGTVYALEEAWQGGSVYNLHVVAPNGSVTATHRLTDPTTGAAFDRVDSLTVGVNGTLYISNPNMFASVGTDGVVTPVVTTSDASGLTIIRSAAVDLEGNVYVSGYKDGQDGQVYKVDGATGTSTPWMPHTEEATGM